MIHHYSPSSHLSHRARVKVSERDARRLSGRDHATRQTVAVQRADRDRMELAVVRGTDEQALSLLDGASENGACRDGADTRDAVHLIYLECHSTACHHACIKPKDIVFSHYERNEISRLIRNSTSTSTSVLLTTCRLDRSFWSYHFAQYSVTISVNVNELKAETSELTERCNVLVRGSTWCSVSCCMFLSRSLLLCSGGRMLRNFIRSSRL